jgi:polar amino acid transport system permease protein
MLAALLGAFGTVAIPQALASGTPPEILKCTPQGTMPGGWTRDIVTVAYVPAKLDGKDDPIDPTRCTLAIDGEPAGATVDDTPMGVSSFLTFSFPRVTTSSGQSLRFAVELVTQGGQVATSEWSFTVAEDKVPGLINFAVVKQWWMYIAKGAYITVYVTLTSMTVACFFALFGALGRLSKKMTFKQAWRKHRSYAYMFNHTLRMIPYWLATFYTSLFRGTPLLLQIFVVYAAIPTFINYGRARWQVFGSIPYPSAIVSGIAALSLNYGAYLAEVFRAGIQSVPNGQTEAAWALGLSGWQTEKRIVLPQAFKIVIPAVGNDFVALIKDTSLVSTIGVMEVLKRAQLVGGRYYDYLTPLLVGAMVYWALTIFFSFWQARLERRMERDRALAY